MIYSFSVFNAFLLSVAVERRKLKAIKTLQTCIQIKEAVIISPGILYLLYFFSMGGGGRENRYFIFFSIVSFGFNIFFKSPRVLRVMKDAKA